MFQKPVYFCFLLVLILMVAAIFPTVLAENAESLSDPIQGEIQDGIYVLRVLHASDASGKWRADSTAQDESVIRLSSAQIDGGDYVARYSPTGDGTATIALRHYNEHACDQVHGFDLLVRDGQIREVTGGYVLLSPLDSDLDPILSGTWLEDSTQFTTLTLSMRENGGWDGEITSPMTHGAYTWKATLYFECDPEGLVYRDACATHLLPDSSEPGSPMSTGSSGTLQYATDASGDIALLWPAQDNPEHRDILFVRSK